VSRAPAVSPRAARRALAAIFAAALALRLVHVGWGLPSYVLPDEALLFVGPAAAVARGTGLVPVSFLHPPVLVYLLAGVYRTAAFVTGASLDLGGPAGHATLARLALLGRATAAVTGALTVLPLFALARHLAGTRAALLAAAAMAVVPFHVLESHRVNPDGASLVLMLCAAERAVAALTRASPWPVLAAFALAGLAGATKYTGLAAAAVPAALLLGTREGPRAQRVGLVAAGALAVAAGFALGMAPAAFAPGRVVDGMRALATFGYADVPPGEALPRTVWTGVRFLYPLVASLPFILGWPLHLLGLAGAVALARRSRVAALVLAAGTVPVFLVVGASPLAVARYYMPIVPYLVLAAGAVLDRLAARAPRAGGVAAALVLGYTALLAVAQVGRMGFGPERAAAARLEARAATARAAGTPLVVAFPSPVALAYDPLGPALRAADVTIVYFPRALQPPSGVRPANADEGGPEAAAAERAWLDDARVDVVVLPSWVRHAIVRAGPSPAAGFHRRLASGALGFERVADLRTTFPTAALYTWADPKLDGAFEAGIVGYELFARPPGARR